ncbi:MAG: XRE family transcriptional regulator [Chloroflexi bacterium]|nr:MAG: XRE family transcriptional regulator [Chloroflexota bacterium]
MCCMQNITGRNIQKFRKQQGLTQDDLATRLQIKGLSHTRNTIAKIEIGLRRVTDIELFAIASILNIDIGRFFNHENYQDTFS